MNLHGSVPLITEYDTLQAKEQFRKALELGDNPFTREKLDQLLEAED